MLVSAALWQSARAPGKIVKGGGGKRVPFLKQMEVAANRELDKDIILRSPSFKWASKRMHGPILTAPRSSSRTIDTPYDARFRSPRLSTPSRSFSTSSAPASFARRIARQRKLERASPSDIVLPSANKPHTHRTRPHKSPNGKPINAMSPPPTHAKLTASQQPLNQHSQHRSNTLGGAGVTLESSGSTLESPAQPLDNEYIDAALKDLPPHHSLYQLGATSHQSGPIAVGELKAEDIVLKIIDDGLNKPVAKLRKDIQRVVFNPGVHVMQDPRTGVWNFNADQLHEIPKPEEFAYERTPPYFPPGEDEDLVKIATQANAKYVGSTSTLTKPFSHIYFALSGNRPVDLSYLSQAYATERTDFTAGANLPAVLTITKGKNGSYFVNNDKVYETENVLTEYGVILEKMLTAEPEDFKRFLKSSPDSAVSEEERNDRGAFQYQMANQLLMRSQLDCHDPRLPGTGVFDIKTRACLPIRHDRANWLANSQYAILTERGYTFSYEREYYDMIRSALLKYSLQARIGMMDGIFVAYHNTARIFGFQYLPLSNIDEHLFGSTEMADQSFKFCVAIFETLMDHAVELFPDQDIRVTIKQAQPVTDRVVTAFVQPANWDGPEDERPIQALSVAIDNYLQGKKVDGSFGLSTNAEKRKSEEWKVKYTITKTAMDAQSQEVSRSLLRAAVTDIQKMMFLSTPEGTTPAEMKAVRAAEAFEALESSARTSAEEEIQNDVEGEQSIDTPPNTPTPTLTPAPTLSATKWKVADARITALRQQAKESALQWAKMKKGWKSEGEKSWETF